MLHFATPAEAVKRAPPSWQVRQQIANLVVTRGRPPGTVPMWPAGMPLRARAARNGQGT